MLVLPTKQTEPQIEGRSNICKGQTKCPRYTQYTACLSRVSQCFAQREANWNSLIYQANKNWQQCQWRADRESSHLCSCPSQWEGPWPRRRLQPRHTSGTRLWCWSWCSMLWMQNTNRQLLGQVHFLIRNPNTEELVWVSVGSKHGWYTVNAPSYWEIGYERHWILPIYRISFNLKRSLRGMLSGLTQYCVNS